MNGPCRTAYTPALGVAGQSWRVAQSPTAKTRSSPTVWSVGRVSTKPWSSRGSPESPKRSRLPAPTAQIRESAGTNAPPSSRTRSRSTAATIAPVRIEMPRAAAFRRARTASEGGNPGRTSGSAWSRVTRRLRSAPALRAAASSRSRTVNTSSMPPAPPPATTTSNGRSAVCARKDSESVPISRTRRAIGRVARANSRTPGRSRPATVLPMSKETKS